MRYSLSLMICTILSGSLASPARSFQDIKAQKPHYPRSPPSWVGEGIEGYNPNLRSATEPSASQVNKPESAGINRPDGGNRQTNEGGTPNWYTNNQFDPNKVPGHETDPLGFMPSPGSSLGNTLNGLKGDTTPNWYTDNQFDPNKVPGHETDPLGFMPSPGSSLENILNNLPATNQQQDHAGPGNGGSGSSGSTGGDFQLSAEEQSGLNMLTPLTLNRFNDLSS
ncbi:hypothetical protein BDV24DRAFT_170421 [Aspergillus arachidicola]|uniref:Uncharacterized protein n=1 Tax=Aspergillus arachidicola TaxID=656916 RepID=A0A5N6XLT0_9EURO|nr:hypothetical protein BDV24DRAFT_170421 [Aspergillus arachidicola]